MSPWLKKSPGSYGAISMEDSPGWYQRNQYWQDMVCDSSEAMTPRKPWPLSSLQSSGRRSFWQPASLQQWTTLPILLSSPPAPMASALYLNSPLILVLSQLLVASLPEISPITSP
ncbi:MAG: hypothetical protein Q9198_004469, partial [Flavoplaca austrocitrina]